MNTPTTPQPGWIAVLNGDSFDLTSWERSLLHPFDPMFQKISHGDSVVWGLRSESFKSCQTPEDVRALAIPLTDMLNGALRAQNNAEPLVFKGVGRIDEVGKLHQTQFAEVRARISGMMATGSAEQRDANGNLVPPPPPAPSQSQKWIQAAATDRNIAKALKHLGKPTNWYDMWTAYEVIEDDLWARTPTKQRPRGVAGSKTKPKRQFLKSQQWVTEAELHTFAESCNYHRHGEKNPPEPEEGASLEDARSILIRILRAWLNARI